MSQMCWEEAPGAGTGAGAGVRVGEGDGADEGDGTSEGDGADGDGEAADAQMIQPALFKDPSDCQCSVCPIVIATPAGPLEPL